MLHLKNQHLGKGDERNLEKNQFPGSKLNFGVVHHPIFLLLVKVVNLIFLQVELPGRKRSVVDHPNRKKTNMEHILVYTYI